MGKWWCGATWANGDGPIMVVWWMGQMVVWWVGKWWCGGWANGGVVDHEDQLVWWCGG